MNFINLTPHDIVVHKHESTVTYKPSGMVARVSTKTSDFVDMIAVQTYGVIEGLPEPKPETLYIVSGLVASATQRQDVVAPATSSPLTIRNDKGHVVSVPGFVRNA